MAQVKSRIDRLVRRLVDEFYADAVARNIVAFPIRFDYDAGDAARQEPAHSKSHLTLGRYQNCRIPVTAPLTAEHFMDFILRNFYHTAFTQFADNSPSFSGSFTESILPSERGVIHMTIPDNSMASITHPPQTPPATAILPH